MLLPLLAAWAGTRGAAGRPNVILVYADDFGFDIAGFGHPTVVTPELDRMIAEGVRSPQPVLLPARCWISRRTTAPHPPNPPPHPPSPHPRP